MKILNQKEIWDSIYQKDEFKWKKESKLPKIMKGKKVLEMGAGNGKTLKSILVQNPKKLVAIDFSSKAISILKRNFSTYDNLFIQKADVLNLPFENNEFDVIICFFTLNNILQKDRNKTVSEIHRVLKNNGILIFSDFALGDYRNKPGKEIENNTIIKSNNLIFHAFSIKEVKKLFKKFRTIELKSISSAPIRKNPELKRKIIYAIFRKLQYPKIKDS